MKTTKKLICIGSILLIAACKKHEETPIVPSGSSHSENYSSIQDFFSRNNVPMQTYTLNGTVGGSFTTLQGTIVTVPANAFVTQSNIPVTGTVTIQFKDVYKKSDMLLSRMTTTTIWGTPLKSGGEFFIKALANNSPVLMAPGKKIAVAQPVALTGGLDTAQLPFVAQPDSSANLSWGTTSTDSVNCISGYYIFSLYAFNMPADSGSWCNSDNPTFFSNYPQTILTLHPTDNSGNYNTDVFLVFNTISSMVHVYTNGSDFPYYYAPQGLQCTLVAVGVNNGVLYSSFVPFTIGSNQTVNFTLSATTTSAFLSQMGALN